MARALLTVIFSDIVGSTGHAARLGDARWGDLLGAHQTVVRREIKRFGGREVKTIGDGFLIAFDKFADRGPLRGLDPAREPRRSDKMLLRCGLHTGECERVGDDLGGMAVHIAARVGALAGPGRGARPPARPTEPSSGQRPELRGSRLAGAQGRARALATVRAARRLTRQTCRPQPSRWLPCWGA